MPKIFAQHEIQDKLNELPSNNDAILAYVNSTDPNNLPTSVLRKLADLMKQRRIQVYENQDINIQVNKKVYKLK